MNIFQPKLFSMWKNYSRKQLISDIVAGVIVAIIALPLSIALAIASGVSPEKGLYTAIVAGFVIAALGGWIPAAGMLLEVAIIALLAFVLLRGFQRRAKWFGIQTCPRTEFELPKGAAVLLALGVLCAAGLYAVDILKMLGG